MRIKLIILFAILLIGYVAFFVFFSNKQDYIFPFNLKGEYNSSKKTANFHKKLVAVPSKIGEPSRDTNVLGSKSSKEKVIKIDLTKQKLYAYEGGKKVMEFLVSTGKWGATPTGEFEIWSKLKYTLMTGGSQVYGTYYYLPNVPYTMYFYGSGISKYQGFGIHGTYWHDNFGHPMSHGCVNMKTSEAEKLFYWAKPDNGDSHTVYANDSNRGTKIVIYGTTPNE